MQRYFRSERDIARTVVKRAAAISSRLAFRRRPAQQFRQLGEVRLHAVGLVAAQPVGRGTAPRRSDMSANGW